MPNLLEIQKSSYKWFLETGLREVFKETDAVTDYSGNLELSFIDYSMDEKPKYTEEECKARDATYAAPLKVRVRLRNKETDEIKEQVIFMGDFPIMTPGGTFVINGAERVIVSQIVRSPGVYFDKTTDKTMLSIYAATVIPYPSASTRTASCPSPGSSRPWVSTTRTTPPSGSAASTTRPSAPSPTSASRRSSARTSA